MGLLNRKPRPLTRDRQQFRDDRLFIVACDDTHAPKQYFDSFELPRIKVVVVPTEDGKSVAKYVLERLEAFDHEEDDELWMLLDTDHCIESSHIAGYMAAIREAQSKGIKVAISRPCFEVWLLLHFMDDEEKLSTLRNAAIASNALAEAIGKYDKTNLDVSLYDFAKVRAACERAQRIDLRMGDGVIPAAPASRVYLLWKSLAAKALPSQLPDELRGLGA